MNLIAVGAVLACVFALTQWWLLPLSRDRWKAGDMRQKIARAGSLVVLEKLRDMAAVGLVVVAAVWLLVALLALLSVTSAALPMVLIETTASLYGVARNAAEQYAAALGMLALVGAALALWIAARQARKRVSQAWIAKAQAMHQRLHEDDDALLQARADPELRPFTDRLDASLRALHEMREAGVSSDAPDRASMGNQAGELISQLAIEMARKDMVFDTVVATPTAAEQAAPRTSWQRVLRMLASDRLCKDMGLVKKPLSYVVTALLVVSTLGWAAEPLADSLRLAVNNLRVNVLDKEAARELGQAVSRAKAEPAPAEPAPLPDAAPAQAAVQATVQSTTRLLARAATRDMARSGIVDRLAGVQRNALAESEFVRAAINGQQLPAAAADVPDTEASRLRREAGHAKAAETPHLQQAVEHELAPHVQQLQRDNPRRFARWAAAVEARYGAVQSPLDAQGKLIARMLDDAFGAVDLHPDSELAKQGHKLAKDFGKDAAKTWAQSFAKTWVTDAIIDSARPAVMAREAGRFVFETTPATRQFAEDLVAAEGRGWVGNAAAQRDAQAVQAVAQKVAGLHAENPAVRQAVLERLGGYDGLFPSTPNEPMPSSGGGGGGGGGGKPGAHGNAHAAPAGRSFAQARATNFHLASRSFRVRGVLIGQDMQAAANARALDLTQLRWTLATPVQGRATPLQLDVRTAAGAWRSVGSFDAGVVNQALRYAADRRVIATTITPGDGKVMGRVTYLHPVLANTPLGCRVVEADRFIDTFSFPTARAALSPEMAPLASDRLQFGRWMALLALAEPVAAVPSAQACPAKEIAEVVTLRKLRTVAFTPALTQSLNAFLDAEDKKLPGSTRLVRSAHACAIGEGGGGLTDCLCNKVKGSGLPPQYWFPEDHTSQFRERKAALTPDGAWLQRTPDRLGHIDLWVHTTFALRRAAERGGGGDVDEATASAVDFPPAQLQLLRRAVAERLPAYLATQLRSPSYDDFMAPLEDFVLLQRFFRAAFAGALGRDFALAQLVELEQATRRFVPAQPTIRWEPVESDQALQETLRSADAAAAESHGRWRADQAFRITTKLPQCGRVSG